MTRSIRNFLATHNLLAISATQCETALNQEQELDTTFLVDLNTVINYRALKTANGDELTGKEEADRLFTALSEGGKVQMPIADQPWGDYYGDFQDKFGVHWMINYHKEE